MTFARRLWAIAVLTWHYRIRHDVDEWQARQRH